MARPRASAWLLIAPSAVVFAGLFIAPFFYFFLVSFWRFRSYRLVRDFTLDNYREVSSGYLWLVRFTLLIAPAVAGGGLALGFLSAYLIRLKAGRVRPLFLFPAL